MFFLYISSSYAKILGEELFCTWEIPRSGSKAEDGEEREKEERKYVITMAKLRMAHASTHGARKHAWRTQASWAKIPLSTYIESGCLIWPASSRNSCRWQEYCWLWQGGLESRIFRTCLTWCWSAGWSQSWPNMWCSKWYLRLFAWSVYS